MSTAKSTPRSFLDFRSPAALGLSSDERASVAKFSTKKLAASHAKKYGWSAASVMGAAGGLKAFWIVAQCQTRETVRALRRDGTWIDFKFTGFV